MITALLLLVAGIFVSVVGVTRAVPYPISTMLSLMMVLAIIPQIMRPAKPLPESEEQ